MAILCMGAVAITNTVSARLRGTGRFAREALWQSAARIASALAVLAVLVLVAVSPFWVFVGWAAGLALLLVWTAPRWWIRPQFKGLSADYPQLWPFVLMALASIWLLKGDIVLLGWLQVPAEDLSLYAACTRLTEAALLIFAPLGNVLLSSFGAAPCCTGFCGSSQWPACSLAASPCGKALGSCSCFLASHLNPQAICCPGC
jgi:O-antigen/teichoic acid export membrane protein